MPYGDIRKNMNKASVGEPVDGNYFYLKNGRLKESFRFLSLIKIAARLRSDVHRNFGEVNQDNYKGFDALHL